MIEHVIFTALTILLGLVLVGLANPDAFSNFQYLTLETESYDSVITTYRGSVLAGSREGARLVGSSVGSIPVFTHFLPAREHASYIGKGALGERQILAFRTSGTKPLVVIWPCMLARENGSADVSAN